MTLPDGTALPDLHTATLDAPTLAQLFADLEACAQVLDVLAKSGPETRADEAPITLSTAHAALQAGTARGVQLRYLYEGAEWRDTILTTPTTNTYKLCRMKMPRPA